MATIQIADKPTLDAVRALLENSGGGKRVFRSAAQGWTRICEDSKNHRQG